MMQFIDLDMSDNVSTLREDGSLVLHPSQESLRQLLYSVSASGIKSLYSALFFSSLKRTFLGSSQTYSVDIDCIILSLLFKPLFVAPTLTPLFKET